MTTQNRKKIADLQPASLTGNNAFIKSSVNVFVKIYGGFVDAILTPVKPDQFIF